MGAVEHPGEGVRRESCAPLGRTERKEKKEEKKEKKINK